MKIHVIEHLNNFTRLKDDLWECGWWKLSEEKARKLVGGKIYFHKSRVEPSFYGGTIRGYRIQNAGQHQGKIVFEFEYDAACRNARTDKYGWSMEMKIVMEPDQASAGSAR